jgi:hypothetical protein
LDESTVFLIRGTVGAVVFALLWIAVRLQFRERDAEDEPLDPGLD